jgi:uncharacterized repeat protein (TIGR02543 family)
MIYNTKFVKAISYVLVIALIVSISLFARSQTAFAGEGEDPQTYHLEFIDNEGVAILVPQDFELNEPFGELPVPTLEGYVFLGWYSYFTHSINGINESSRRSQVLETTTIADIIIEEDLPFTAYVYAHWSKIDPETFTLTFDSEGGTEVDPIEVLDGEFFGNYFPTSTKSGYRLMGWYTKGEDSHVGLWYYTIMTKSDIYYASWEPRKYFVNFDSNGGEEIFDNSRSVYFDMLYGGDDISSPVLPFPTTTRNGYTFAGWFADDFGGVEITESSILDIPSSHTLYAHWTPNEYTVSFNPNGGNALSSSDSVKVVKNGDKYKLPTPSRTGYGFAGWFTAVSGGNQITANSVVNLSAAQTLYARWTANSYKITHDVNGGKAVKTKSKTVKYDSAYGELQSTSRTGHKFEGWYTAKSGGTKVTNSSKVQTAQDHTLYAHWTAKEFTVKLNVNGGKALKAKDKSLTVTYAKKFGKLVTPKRTGYKFDGWYTAKKGGSKITANSKVNITKTTTLYAHWKKK